MIDHILGRPSASLRRSQIFLVLFFWVWRLYKGDGAPLPTRTATGLPATSSSGVRRPGSAAAQARRRTWWWKLWIGLVGRHKFGIGWINKINDRLKHFTPYQLILGTFTILYAVRHLDDLFGLGAPEPLARLYSRSYYRATYVNTAFDAGFASAMAIRPRWLKDICSVVFSAYYLVWANEGDEVLRRFRALCTVEMLRVTWEKTRNPYVRFLTAFQRPRLPLVRTVSIPRPTSSSRANLPPVKGLLFFDGSEKQLASATELVMDFPGGGFIAMGPDCHEERLRRWAKRTGKPVLGIDYGKAPEYPYPWAIEEGFDAYRTIQETKGRCIGMRSGRLGVVLTGDSAGGNICTTIIVRILEHHTAIPRPISIILAYPALDFNFTSWMSPANLRVLRTEHSENNIPGIKQGKDHMSHKSPLAVVDDVQHRPRRSERPRQKSWGEAVSSKLPGLAMSPAEEKTVSLGGTRTPRATSPVAGWKKALPRVMSAKVAGWLDPEAEAQEGETEESTSEDDDDVKTVRGFDARREAEKSLRERVKTPKEERHFDLPSDSLDDVAGAAAADVPKRRRRKAPIGTRMTMTSRVGYFQDRIISPSMMRAMAILYIGPRRNPDFETDYYISPVLAPAHLLAHFPPVYLICGERDPFVDDTVIFSGRVREAKRKRRAEAEFKLQGQSAKFGEGLRMSSAPAKPQEPDHILRETDDDWVQMRIIEGWGHGFMQMASLMKEVDSVLTEMADWIDESFEKALETQREAQETAAAHVAAQEAFRPDEPVLLSPSDQMVQPSSTFVKPAKQYAAASTSSHRPMGGADLGAPVASGSSLGGQQEVEGEEDGMISFKAKQKRTPPPSRFFPVPRRPSKEQVNLYRSSSAPKFDLDEYAGSSGETVDIATPPAPPLQQSPLSAGDEEPKGMGTFAFFNAGSSKKSPPASRPIPNHSSIYGGSAPSPTVQTSGPLGTAANRRNSNSSGSPSGNKPTNSLLSAAVAGARAASPALAAAGFVPQSIGNVSEAELMRRRRLEAVFGMGETDSNHTSDNEDEDEEMYEGG